MKKTLRRRRRPFSQIFFFLFFPPSSIPSYGSQRQRDGEQHFSRQPQLQGAEGQRGCTAADGHSAVYRGRSQGLFWPIVGERKSFQSLSLSLARLTDLWLLVPCCPLGICSGQFLRTALSGARCGRWAGWRTTLQPWRRCTMPPPGFGRCLWPPSACSGRSTGGARYEPSLPWSLPSSLSLPSR